MIDYTGYLIAAHPLMQNLQFQHGVIFVADNCKTHGTFGLQINHIIKSNYNLVSIMDHLGFSTVNVDDQIPIYRGGNQNNNRIYVLHSSEWQGKTTVKFSNGISLTSDISILHAISRNEEPKFFRIIAGSCFWPVGELENQIMNLNVDNNFNTWTYAVANKRLVFNTDGRKQWSVVLEKSSSLQVDRWFN